LIDQLLTGGGLFSQVDLSTAPTLVHWIAFSIFVGILLTLDLTVFHRKSHEPTLRESLGWTIFWCSLALGFNALVWYWLGNQAAIEFLTGYLIEWSLSMDNVFVFAVVFGFFGVPLKYQYRVLFWGIMGAVVMRLTFVLLGTALIERFEFVIPVFGAFLIYTGIKLAVSHDSEVDPSNNLLLRIARRLVNVSRESHGQRFFVIENGKRCVTPLFLVLLVVESTDVLFAVDSVPAIFSVVSRDADYFQFIVFTSNIFAILGLRALYFLLAGVMDLFRYLNYGLSAVLVFVGIKMVAEYVAPKLFDIDTHGHLVPPPVSLAIVVSLIGTSIAASIIAKRREDRRAALAEPRDLNTEAAATDRAESHQ
jgi:tellurite resistance protein TerC